MSIKTNPLGENWDDSYWEDEYVHALQKENETFRKLLTEYYETQTNMDFWVRVGEALGIREED